MLKKYKDLTYKERALIAKQRLLDPSEENKKFAEDNGITTQALTRIEKLLNFDEDTAVGAIMTNILAKDNELIALSTDLKNKWAKQVEAKRTILNKDIDTLDKIEGTAMKRAALIKAAEDAKESNAPLDIKITL